MRYSGFLILIACALVLEACHTNHSPQLITPVIPEVSQYGTPFANVPSPENAVNYQVNIRAFGPEGNFAGVVDRLDSIQKLGINVVYLMPVFPVGKVKSVNSPYCVQDYTGINPAFGDLAGLRAIVDGAHTRNMAVMLDWVANHTSFDNAWITRHPDWYLQSNGVIQSPPNTNFTDVAQLNFDNADMKSEMIKDMKYWVYAANVDGFRCDFADHPPASFWTQAIDTLRSISTHKLLLLAEGSRPANFTSGFDYNFGFNYYGQLKSIFANAAVAVTNLNALTTNDYIGSSGTQQIVRYLNNHDVNGSDGTALDLFGGIDGSLAAFVVTAYMKGVPMIYNGQEVGDPTRIPFPFTTVKIDWKTHPEVTAAYRKIIALRSSSDALREGAVTLFSNTNVCAFAKVLNSDTVVVISNLRGTAGSLALPSWLANSSRWKDAFHGDSGVTLGSAAALSGYQYVVLKNH